MILENAEKVSAGGGICVVWSFEPIPLYSTLEWIGLRLFLCSGWLKSITNPVNASTIHPSSVNPTIRS
jgi:hypothetical protein